MKSKKMRIVLSYLEIYAFSLLILILTVMFLLRITLLNKNFVQRQFTNEHYINVEQSLKMDMKNSMISSGIDNSIIDDLFDSNDIEKSTNQILNILYTNPSLKLDTSDIESKLRDNIRDELEKKNFKLDDESGYNNFVDSIINIYRQEFEMLNQVSKIGKVILKLEKPMLIGIIFLSMILFLLIVLRRKKVTKILPPALLTTSFLLLFGTIYSYQKAGLANTTIISITFSSILRKIVKETFDVYQFTAVLYILIVIIIVSFMNVRKRKYHHRHSHN